MADYISRERLIKKLDDSEVPENERIDIGYNEALKDVKQYLTEMPAADVQPIKHGRWIPQGDDMWLCSNCKENIIFSMHESDRTEKQRYCCKCGARMDGGING